MRELLCELEAPTTSRAQHLVNRSIPLQQQELFVPITLSGNTFKLIHAALAGNAAISCSWVAQQ
ncbi:uncharacterized protein PHALS_11868 [Plasmopara halstedii]|uniref:Uncharacterized protein n=1 Tax=Plasmopara halstedii TaxID=4781 RepID=A0A0P1AKT2_PLAHL|nr:uncharacterized protein PHALS_11868 [Plasmopara halstedii]CEG41527.1 hypothetical protein PHALS_11868 [Plasmopara halstedii]|eukprot:XP_024577896.1 hypothetical protein PHALS_11868 [Plasmopara halstedii]